MASDPPEIVLSSSLSELFSRINKDTDGWAESLSDNDIDTVQDLLETDLEDIVEIVEAAGKIWSTGKRNALRSVLKNSATLNLPSNWTFLSRVLAPPVTPGSSLNRSQSVGSSSKCTKPLFARKPHSGLKDDVICRALSCFARLLGFLAPYGINRCRHQHRVLPYGNLPRAQPQLVTIPFRIHRDGFGLDQTLCSANSEADDLLEDEATFDV